MNKLISKHNINLIDPSKVYLVKDLYYLIDRSSKILPIGVSKRKIIKKGFMSIEEIKLFFNKPLHQCQIHELKFLWILALHKRRTKLTEIGIADRITEIFFLDFLDVLLCFINELPRDYENNLLTELIKPNLDILDGRKLEDLRDVKLCHRILSRNIIPYTPPHYYIRNYQGGQTVTDNMPLLESGIVQLNHSDQYRRPFRDPRSSEKRFPIHEIEDTIGMRMRDLISIGATNNSNRSITYLVNNSKLLGISQSEYIKFIHKPVEGCTQEDLDNCKKILQSKELYINYLDRFIKAGITTNYKATDGFANVT